MPTWNEVKLRCESLRSDSTVATEPKCAVRSNIEQLIQLSSLRNRVITCPLWQWCCCESLPRKAPKYDSGSQFRVVTGKPNATIH
eukprot:2802147-Amphidinium_carterae.2